MGPFVPISGIASALFARDKPRDCLDTAYSASPIYLLIYSSPANALYTLTRVACNFSKKYKLKINAR